VIDVKRLFRFAIAGVVNTVMGYGVIAGAMYLGASPAVANMSGYAVGLVISFVQSRYWVFESKGHVGLEWLKFVAVFAISYACNFLTLRLLLGIPINPYLAQLFACAVFVVINFVLNSRFVFATKRPRERDAIQ
jgi:putative flippase GtrA